MDKRSGVPRVREVVWLGSLCVVGGACARSEERADRVGGGAAEAIEVSPELELDPPDLVPAPGAQLSGAPIRAGDHYLALWSDERAHFGLKPAARIPQLMAARIDPSGTVLDPTGFPIATDPASTGMVGASCNPDGLCLILTRNWFDTQAPIVGVRLLNDQVVGSAIVSGPAVGLVSVVWDGAVFRLLVVSPSDGAFMRTVGEDGAIGPEVPVAVEEIEDLNAIPRIACGGGRCLLTYFESNGVSFDVMARMLDHDGTFGDAFAISAGPIGSEATAPVWDGARFWVAVKHVIPPVELRLVRVEIDGTILDPDVLVATPPSIDQLALTHDGTQLLVSWQVPLFPPGSTVAEVRTARVTPDGDVLDAGGVPFLIPSRAELGLYEFLSGVACHHTAACLMLVVHRDDVDGGSVVGYRLEGAAVVDPDGVLVSASPPGQLDPAVAFGSGRYLAVWRDSRMVPPEPPTVPLRAALFAPAMDEFVPLQLDVTFNAEFRGVPQADPTAAASASSYLVAWSAELPPRKRSVFGEVLGPDGQPIRTTFSIHDTTRLEARPSAASSGDGFLVAWERLDPGTVHAIRASRFDATGAALAPEQFLVTSSGYLPAAAFGGGNYVVVWQRPKSPTNVKRDVAAARVSPAGAVLDPTPIVIADSPAIDHSHSVACGGGVCLVVWHTAPSQLRALRLAPDGTVLDPGGFLIASASGVPATSVVFDGTAFLVGWQTKSGDMHGAVISPDGVVTEPAFVIANAATPLQHPVVASDGAGHRFVLYDRFDPSPGHNVRRVRARVLEAETGP
jgi:hypothetical protein